MAGEDVIGAPVGGEGEESGDASSLGVLVVWELEEVRRGVPVEVAFRVKPGDAEPFGVA